MLWNTDDHKLAGASTSVHVVAVRLEAGGGSWVGTLDGTGAFAGGTLIVDIESFGPGSAWRVEGLAVTRDLPPAAALVR